MASIAAIVAELTRIHDEAVAALRADIERFARDGTPPPPERRSERSWCYPELRIAYAGKERLTDITRSFGRLSREGTYACTVTRPALFADYLTEQLELLTSDYEVTVEVARSRQEIPFPYVFDGAADLGGIGAAELARHFPAAELAHIGDELADGLDLGLPEDPLPLALVNIGVGPANAKNICDHLAVLRPEAWLMIGHCGGLRDTQHIGDYVLAHAYLRDDNVLDAVLPPEIPIPAIAEVQLALVKAAEMVSGAGGIDLKKRMRTGTVVTTDDRNWELRYTYSAHRLSQSRAVAIAMETGT